jgi:hypothetical protein
MSNETLDAEPIGRYILWPADQRVPIGWEPASLHKERPPAPPGYTLFVHIVKIHHARPKGN